MSLTEAQLRSIVQDPSGTTQMLSTTDYSTAIAIETNNFRQIGLVCKMLAAHFAGKVDMSAGSVRMANQQKFEHYMQMARDFDLRSQSSSGNPGSLSPIATGISMAEIDTIETDTDIHPASFTQDMMSPSYQLGHEEEEYA